MLTFRAWLLLMVSGGCAVVGVVTGWQWALFGAAGLAGIAALLFVTAFFTLSSWDGSIHVTEDVPSPQQSRPGRESREA